MAKVNPVKLKQDADKLEKAGRLEQAIALYRQIVEENPRDWNTINKIGDLYAKLNRLREASDHYAKVADFYAKDGFHLKAIAIWKKINKLDPTALEPYLSLADLYAKQGLMMEAKSQYQIVVDEFVKRGKVREAGDVLRKMADIDPGDLKIRSKLADLYTRDGSAAKAVEEHVAIADQLNKKGHLAEALQVLEKGLKLDPKSMRLRVELGRIHLVQKNHERAAHFLEEASRLAPQDAQVLARLGEAYVGARKLTEAETVFKRLLELQPGDEDTRVQMGRLYAAAGRFDAAYEHLAPVVDRMLAQREGEAAAGLLQQIVHKSPAHVKSLVKLGEVYRALHNDAEIVATYSRLAEAYINGGDMEQAASVLEMLVGLEPQNQQHQSKLEFVRGKLDSGGAAAARPGAPARPAPRMPAPGPPFSAQDAEFLEEEFELPSEEAPAPAAPAAPAQRAPAVPFAIPPGLRPPIELSGPLSEEDREFIDEHMAEGKVFRKYGLVDKAADQFESVVARFPDHLEARHELREVFREKGQPSKAAEQCLALAEICRLRGDASAAEAHEAEARRLAPEVVAAAAAPVVLPPEIAPPAPADRRTPLPAARAAKATPAAAPAPEPEEAEEEIVVGGEEALELGGEDVVLENAPEEAEIGVGLDEQPAGDVGSSLDLEETGDAELTGTFVEEEPEEPAPFLAAGEPGRQGGELPAEAPLDLGSELPAIIGDLGGELAADLAPPDLVPEVPPPTLEPASALRLDEPPPPPAIVDTPDLVLGLGDIDIDAEAPPLPPHAPEVHPGVSAPVERQRAPSAGRAPAARPAAMGVPADLRKVLDEVDEYFSLGFLEDAVDALREVAGRHPGHPAIVAKMQALGLEPSALGEPAPPAIAPALPLSEDPLPHLRGTAPAELVPNDSVDLGAELDELFRAQPAVEEPPAAVATDLGDAGLADIFKEFKKGVDRQLGKEDYDTRYNLGIAYKEMGLVDEAIAEFQLAAKDEARLLECSSMLGICFMEKGMPKLAVRWFEKGLQARGRSEEEYQGLRYDLALAYEAAGEADKALSLYTDLYGQDANFRDVAAKVRELRAARR